VATTCRQNAAVNVIEVSEQYYRDDWLHGAVTAVGKYASRPR